MSILWPVGAAFLLGMSVGAAIAGELTYRALYRAWLKHVFDYHSEEIER